MKTNGITAFLLFLLLTGCQRPEQTETADNTKPTPTFPETLTEPTERPKSLSWGEEDVHGLQMGSWFDRDQQVIWCVIRNKGDRSIVYSDYLLGYWESVTLSVQSEEPGKWHTISRKENSFLFYKSAGAFSRNIHILPPKKEMPPPYSENGTLIPVATEPVYTFGVRLKDFEWPEDLDRNVQLVVSQSLGNDGSKDTWTGTLQSGLVHVPRVSEETKNPQRHSLPNEGKPSTQKPLQTPAVNSLRKRKIQTLSESDFRHAKNIEVANIDTNRR